MYEKRKALDGWMKMDYKILSQARVVELVDTLVLEASTSVCEFESRLGHQISVM